MFSGLGLVAGSGWRSVDVDLQEGVIVSLGPAPGVETETGGDGCRLCVALELPGFPRNWAEPKRTMAKPKYTPNVWLVMVFGVGLGWVGFAGFGRVGMVRIGVVGWQDG